MTAGDQRTQFIAIALKVLCILGFGRAEGSAKHAPSGHQVQFSGSSTRAREKIDVDFWDHFTVPVKAEAILV